MIDAPLTPNRATRRREVAFVEKELLSLAQRVVKLDKSIERVRKDIENVNAEDTKKIRELNEKLARLVMQAEKVGGKYDAYAKQHQDMYDFGEGESRSIISALEKAQKTNATSDDDSAGSTSAH